MFFNSKIPKQKALIPTTIVILGITGDLARRKLIPALWHLYIKGYLPDEFFIVGFSRSGWLSEELQVYVKDILKEKMVNVPIEAQVNFLKRVSYVIGDFNSEDSYRKLSGAILGIDEKLGLCTAKLFHLAVPPELYEGIFERLHASGLADMCGGLGGWTRVLVEKPFGNNWYTAEKLDQKLGSFFREEQIFRVDHYMGKEAMQNILAFRFSNALLEYLWSNAFIEKVHVRLWEEIGLEGRGAFYDNAGALRDVGQNHMLQMLSFLTMEDPGVLDTEIIRKERAKIAEALRPISRDEMGKYVKRGQYRGFLDEPSVRAESKTETYFRVEAYIENERWKGVPFFLESGKRLGTSKAEIEVVFRKKISCLCPPDREVCLCPEGEEQQMQNRLLFKIQPHEEIAITFFAKHPGFEMKLEPKVLSFSSESTEEAKDVPDAYERIIFDCISGDQTLFASTKEVLGAWKFITPIIESWDAIPLDAYEPGWIPE